MNNKQRNKGGRPKKSASEKLRYKVSFFLQTSDYLDLKVKAKVAKLPRAEVVRRAVTSCRITPRFTPEQVGWMRNLMGMDGKRTIAVTTCRSISWQSQKIQAHELSSCILL